MGAAATCRRLPQRQSAGATRSGAHHVGPRAFSGGLDGRRQRPHPCTFRPLPPPLSRHRLLAPPRSHICLAGRELGEGRHRRCVRATEPDPTPCPSSCLSRVGPALREGRAPGLYSLLSSVTANAAGRCCAVYPVPAPPKGSPQRIAASPLCPLHCVGLVALLAPPPCLPTRANCKTKGNLGRCQGRPAPAPPSG